MIRYAVYALLIFVALILAPLVANYLMADNGYVLINIHDRVLETTVPAMLVALVLLYIAIRVAGILWRGTWGLGKAAQKHRQRQARKKLTSGLIQITEGNWLQGEKMLVRSANLSETPLLNYLGAARAAQLQGAFDRRDRWLALAAEKDDSATTAVLLTQAELQLERDQYEQALDTLRKLEEVAPGNKKGQVLLANIYAHLGEWRPLKELLPRLTRLKDLPAEQLDKWTLDAHVGLFREVGAASIEDAHQRWNEVPRKLRKKPEIVRAYIAALRAAGDAPKAALGIINQLKRDWDSDLAGAYGLLELPDATRQLAQAENWLKQHPDDATLLLTAARLSMRNKLWGKARSYFEASLAIHPTALTYDAYGRLLEQLGEISQANAAFRKGIELATNPGTSVQVVPAT